MTTYLLAGGGTAGHVNPLLAVADALRDRDPDAEILVLGTREGLEARLVPERGYELLFVDKVPFPRRPNRDAAAFPTRFRRAVAQVRAHLRDRGVDVVVGFGGYASAPAYVAARRARRARRRARGQRQARAWPTSLGARTRRARRRRVRGDAAQALARSSGCRCAARSSTSTAPRSAPRRRRTSGSMPIARRCSSSAARSARCGSTRRSARARRAWRDVLDAGWQLVHVTGERSTLVDPGAPGYAVRRYVDRMDLAFALADLIVSRAGAATVSEISALGIPAVYVPYAVGNGEQALNAASAVRAGAAILIPDAEFTADRVRAEIVPLLADRARRAAMTEAAASVGTRTGTENVVAMIDEALGGSRRGSVGDARRRH